MKKTSIHFDSRDRLSFLDTTSTSYVLPLPTTLTDVVSARLVSVEMPSSFYAFQTSYGNTSVRVTVHTSSGPITSSVEIPDGNYDGNSIANNLQHALDTAFAPLTFAVGVSQSDSRLSIENVDGFEVEVHTTDADDTMEYSRTLAYFLGFEFDTVAKGSPLYSHHVVRLNPFTYAMLDIGELAGGYEGGMFGTRYAPSSSVFAKVPINSNAFTYTYWEPQNMTMVELNPAVSRLDRLTVHWRFHDMTPIDFQNMEHSFTIEFVSKSSEENKLDIITEKLKFIASCLSSTPPPIEAPSSETLVRSIQPSAATDEKEPLITRPVLIMSSLATLIIVVWILHRG